ncbi:MAG: SDR family oxidoreductase [Pigmentiphaga sp.]|uniref:SDR family NAD(P)-dependent oxidoreductase n=1 Tax=Pigmentiphaga sp. TaxID=1977564 RepID=UPI0029AD7D3A|nr:SDR family oxidoreductase [Pigmentiphaga sp.]MDX3905908.1 SDR family oxidoreductase [Pigmentiphaga sp.]
MTRAPVLSFDASVVMITGASKGIGLACALAFARAGATVAGISRSQANLDTARAALRAEGLDMHAIATDLTDEAAALAAVQRVEDEIGPLSVLVNSAGAARRYAPEQLGGAAFRQAMDAKYFSYMHVLDAVARRMAGRKRGSIVNVIGQGGKSPGSFHIAGGAANAALMLATVGYARAYAAAGVRFNAINPGLTRTGRVEEGLAVAAQSSGQSPEQVLAQQVADIPMGRLAEPDEIANVAMFLASDLASYVSGAVIPMDGCAAPFI